MSEWQKYKKSLRNHSGIDVALIMQLVCAISGATRTAWPMGVEGALFGLVIGSLVWVPVLWTAWTARKRYDEE